jgi:hypothetical protein
MLNIVVKRAPVRVFCIILLWGSALAQPWQDFQLTDLVADTLRIELDSLSGAQHNNLRVNDLRGVAPQLLDIQQTQRFKFIPVDQHVVLSVPLAQLFTHELSLNSVTAAGDLNLVKTILWYDSKPLLEKGRRLNAYTTLFDSSGQPLSDWIWEISVEKIKKEEETATLKRLVTRLASDQAQAIAERDFHPDFYPFLYRRQLMTWTDFILYRDGFALNAHLTLDFPPDQFPRWVRGSPGLYYRRGKHHESIAIGGMDQRWYRRLNDSFITYASATYRFGFNNFDGDYYGHLDAWNIIFLQLSSQISVEYRPVYHKGLFTGLGLYNSLHLLPEVIETYDPGLAITFGVLLP